MEKKLTSEDLAAAARYLDSKLLDGGGTDETQDDILKELGVDFQDLAYVANQRALRVILLILRGEKVPSDYKLAQVQLDEQEKMLMSMMSGIAVDAMAIGIAASQGRSAPMPSKDSEN